MVKAFLSILKRKDTLFVISLIILSTIIRVWNINKDLLFQHDQGMVAMDVYRIWHDKKISLIGPMSDVDGLVHSPIYYWVLTPVFALAKSEVWIPAVFQILLEMFSLPFLYLTAKKLFDRKTAVITLILYAVSYGLVSYSRWFITVPMSLPLTNLLLYSLVYKKGAFLSSLLVGTITQLDAAVGVFYFPFLFFHYRKEINLKKILIIVGAFLIPAIPLIIFQFRHDFVNFRAVLNYFLNKEAGVGFNFLVYWNNLNILLRQIGNLFLFPFISAASIVFAWAIYMVSKTKSKAFVFSYLLIPFIFLGFFQRGAISFFNIAALPLCLMLLSYAFSKLPKVLIYPVLIAIIGLNAFYLGNIYKPNNALIPIGDDNVITLEDRKNVIDWMYQKAGGESFSFWTYVLPYFQEYTWDYLFLTYAPQKYGYLPEKTKSFSKGDLKYSKYFFDTYEADDDNPDRQNAWFAEIEKEFGKVNDSFSSHDLHVELRERLDL